MCSLSSFGEFLLLAPAHVARCTICSMAIARTGIAIFIVRTSYACGMMWMESVVTLRKSISHLICL